MNSGHDRGEEPTIAVVILNWNAAQETLDCIGSVLAMDRIPDLIVVPDNDSKPEQVAVLREGIARLDRNWRECRVGDELGCEGREPGEIVLLHTGANLGFAGGVNRGIELADRQGSFDWIWVLNNDTVVRPDTLTELVKRAAADPRIGICGSTLVYLRDRRSIQALGGSSYSRLSGASRALGFGTTLDQVPDDPSDVERSMGYVVGASMLVSRQFLSRVGLMDESYFLYSEEHDWAERGKDEFRLGWAPRSVVYHIHGASIGSDASGGSALSMFYLYRNKIVFTWRHHATTLPMVAVGVLWRAFKFLLKGKLETSKAMLLGILAAPGMGAFPRHRFQGKVRP